jgi:hypothetical protein
MDLILGNKKESGGDKLEEYWGDLVPESLILPKTGY